MGKTIFSYLQADIENAALYVVCNFTEPAILKCLSYIEFSITLHEGKQPQEDATVGIFLDE